MSDFCQQCSIELFNEDLGDLRGITKLSDTEAGLFASVICEGCGFILVNHDGKCVSKDCIKHHYERKSNPQ